MPRQTIIQASNQKNVYEVVIKKKDDEYLYEPRIKCTKSIVSWTDIKTFQEELDFPNTFYLNEDEYVNVIDKIVRADINAVIYQIGKVLSVVEENKEESEILLEQELKAYREQKISKNPTLSRFCEICGIDKSKVDADELLYIFSELSPKSNVGGIVASDFGTIVNCVTPKYTVGLR